MEYRGKRRPFIVQRESTNFKELYPHDMSMYTEFPESIVQLHDFLQYGVERRQSKGKNNNL